MSVSDRMAKVKRRLRAKSALTESQHPEQTARVQATASRVTTEHFDVAIKTHRSLDTLTYSCKGSLSSWPRRKGLSNLILYPLLIFVLLLLSDVAVVTVWSTARVDLLPPEPGLRFYRRPTPSRPCNLALSRSEKGRRAERTSVSALERRRPPRLFGRGSPSSHTNKTTGAAVNQ